MNCLSMPPYPSWYSDKKIRKKERKRMKVFWSRTNNYGAKAWLILNVENQHPLSPLSPLAFDRMEAAKEEAKTHYHYFISRYY